MIHNRTLGTALATVLLGVIPLAAVAGALPQSAATSGTGAIEGYVFQDDDANGQFGPDEFGLAAVPVRLSGVAADVTMLTDDDGNYGFGNLAPGSYDVMVEPGPTWSVVGESTYADLVIAAETLTGLNFGLQPEAVPTLAVAALPGAAATTTSAEGGEGELTSVRDAVTEIAGFFSEPEPTAEDAAAGDEAAADAPDMAEPATGEAAAEDMADAAEAAAGDQVAGPAAADEPAADAVDVAEPATGEAAAEAEGMADTEADAVGDEAAEAPVAEPALVIAPAAVAEEVPALPQTGVGPVNDRGLVLIAMLGLAVLGGAGMLAERRRDED